MKKWITLGLITLVSAGASGFISWKMRANSVPAVGAVGAGGGEHGAPPAHGAPANESHTSTESHGATSHNDELPVAVRAKPMTVEEILKYGSGLRKREETLKKRELDLSQQEAQLRLVFADIQSEQREVDGLRALIREQTEAANSIVEQTRQKHAELDQTRTQVDAQKSKVEEQDHEEDNLHKENIKRMSAWFQSMEPAKAAQFLKELVNDGNMPMAVQLLSNFEEREAAKVLSALDDPSLMVQLAESFKELKRPQKSASK